MRGPSTHARRRACLNTASSSVLVALAFAVLCFLPRASHAARLPYPVRGTGAQIAGPAVAGERLVLRLRSSVAHAAYAQLEGERDSRRLAARRVPALAALSARLLGARLEPEFPACAPGESPDLSTFWIAHLEGRLAVETALDVAGSSAEVEEASPIYLEPIDDPSSLAAAGTAWPPLAPAARGGSFNVAAPNDSMWGLCYWLQQTSRRDLHALEAWDITRGDSTSVIAIIDTGVLRYHPDLAGTTAGEYGNLWTNAAERRGVPGVDDDGNGFVDDVWGWDYVSLDSAGYARAGEDWRDADNDPNDLAVHGTAVAGVAAAIANNVSGIAGVAPGARIMALRVGYSASINPAGVVDLSWAAQAINYATRNGATVINCSFGSDQQPDLLAAVTAAVAAGVLVVTASGNNGTHHYLADRDDVISVASTDQNDRVTFFSNRGAYVDLCAPGQSIATTTLRATGADSIGLRTAYYSPAEAGTSFSSPMVAAAAAMMQSDRRAHGMQPLKPYLAQLRITETTDNISGANNGSGYGTGRLNVQRLLADPQHSNAFAAGAATIGPPVVLPTQSGAAWAAYATADSGLLVMHAVRGDTIVRVPLGSLPVGGLAAADLGLGRGTGIFVALEDGRIAGYYAAGAPLPGWPVDATTTRGGFEAMPALGDLDGDGGLEVVWGGDDGSVWAWHADGSRVDGFPRRAGTAGRNLRVALGNLDGQPGLEIVVTSNNYTVYAFKGDGSPLTGWPVIVGDEPTAPIIMKLGSNPTPAVVVAANTELRAVGPTGVSRFRTVLPSPVAQDLAAGDLDGDGRDEIVVLMKASDQIASYDSTGRVIDNLLLTVHSSGPPLIGPLATGPGANPLFPSPDNQGRTRYFAYTSNLADLRGWPKSGHPSNNPSMADVDNDGATELAAGSGTDGLIYLYDAGPGTWRPGAARWPTARGNFARTGSRLDSPALTPGDDVAPLGVGSLAADEPSTHEVMLRWLAPADPGSRPRVAAYDLRRAAFPISVSTFAAAERVPQGMIPATPGAPESLRVANLPESAHLWFALRSRDAEGNWSPLSNGIEVVTPTRTPAVVTDLRVEAGGDSSLTLVWTASGDDERMGRPARYRIRLTTTVLDSAAFEAATLGVDAPATVDAGRLERVTLRNLPRGQRFWAGLRAVDAAGNTSPLSNAIAPSIGRLAKIAGVALLPSRSPSRVPVQIEWQGALDHFSEPQAIFIYDVGGRIQKVFTLPAAAGGEVTWDGRTREGLRCPAGIYFTRLVSGPFEARGRIVLLR